VSSKQIRFRQMIVELLELHSSGRREWNLDGDSLWKANSSNFSVDVLSLLKSLFPSDDLGNTLDEDVDELGLGLAESIGVGDVPGATGGGGVDTSGSSGLETHLAEDLLEVSSGRELWDLDHGASSETSSEVGWAGKNPTEMVVVHEVVTFLLEDLLDALGSGGESLEDFDDGSALLHGDNSHLILLVDPDEEVLGLVVVDTSGIGPVSAATGRKKKSGVGLLEEVSVLSEGFFLFLGHTGGLGSVGTGAVKREVVTLKVALEVKESLDDDSLEFSSLFERAAWRKSSASDGSASSASSGKDVLASRIDGSGGKVGRVHVSRVLGIGSVAVVSSGDDGVEELLEELVGLFITSDGTDSLDHGVTLVINTGLDAVSNVDAELGGLGLKLLEEVGLGTHGVGEEGSVVGKIGKLGGHAAGDEGGLLLGAVVLSIAAAKLNPFGKSLDGGGKASWWVVRHCY